LEEPDNKDRKANNKNQITRTKESQKIGNPKSDGIHDELKIRNQKSKIEIP
jgi:hypothetical protein